MTSQDLVVVHYAELGTKGKNRSFFVGVLRRNLRLALAGLPIGSIQSRHARLFVHLSAPLDDALRDAIRERLRPVMGIAHFGFAARLPARDLEVLASSAVALAERACGSDAAIRTFAVDTRRADREFPHRSPEVNRRIGAAIQAATGLAVDLRDPDLGLYVEILPDGLLLAAEREEGQRGLPVGSSAAVVALLSSGIDSPVAAWRVLGRGCRVVYAHFHSMPFTQRASLDLAVDLVRCLAPYQPRSELYLVPFAEIQRHIAIGAPPALRVVLYRRWMLRLAEKIAHKVGARALVTGDSIGQVASQTVENLATIEQASTLPVLRPLVATGKEEIIALARRLGTYDISTQPYDDCCAYLMPQSPETHARLAAVLRAEEELGPLDDLAWNALARAERLRMR